MLIIGPESLKPLRREYSVRNDMCERSEWLDIVEGLWGELL